MDEIRLRQRAVVGALTALALCVGVGTAAVGSPVGGSEAFAQVLTDPSTSLLTTTTPLEVNPVNDLLEPTEELLEPAEELLDPPVDLLTTTTTTTVATTTTIITTPTSSVIDDQSTQPVATTSTTEATDGIDLIVAPPADQDDGVTGAGGTASPDPSGVEPSPPDLRFRSFLTSSDPIVPLGPSGRAPASARGLVLAFFADGLGSPLGALIIGPLLALAALWDAVVSAGAGLAGPASALMTLVVVVVLDSRRLRVNWSGEPGVPVPGSGGPGAVRANEVECDGMSVEKGGQVMVSETLGPRAEVVAPRGDTPGPLSTPISS